MSGSKVSYFLWHLEVSEKKGKRKEKYIYFKQVVYLFIGFLLNYLIDLYIEHTMETTPLPINKVAQSGLVTLDLDNYYPKEQIVELDIADFLFKGLVLREKEFRDTIANFDWSKFQNKVVAVHCSTDAIVAKWAYMLISAALNNIAKEIYFGNPEGVIIQKMLLAIEKIDFDKFKDEKVIVKGCGKFTIPTEIYVAVSSRLLPLVQSLMYGEACSTVPIYKRKTK